MLSPEDIFPIHFFLFEELVKDAHDLSLNNMPTPNSDVLLHTSSIILDNTYDLHHTKIHHGGYFSVGSHDKDNLMLLLSRFLAYS